MATAYGKVLRPEQYEFAPKIRRSTWPGKATTSSPSACGKPVFPHPAGPCRRTTTTAVAARVIADLEDEHKADAVFVDAGYGTGIVSAGQGMGRDWTLVWFAGRPADIGCLEQAGRRCGRRRDWLKSGGALPMTRSCDELQAPEIVPRADGRVQIESKKDMKARGVPSPNRADALVLSFASPSSSATRSTPTATTAAARGDYDPYRAMR